MIPILCSFYEEELQQSSRPANLPEVQSNPYKFIFQRKSPIRGLSLS